MSPIICYTPKRFGESSMEIIDRANLICSQYREQGFDLTLRQLYYQFVSRGWIENRDKEYHRLGSVINDARLAGMLDWNYIVDRTRNLRSNSHWGTPGDIINSAAQSYATDKWSDQEHYVEVWVEKDALVGVIERTCVRNDVPFFSCRGYTSQSELWSAAMRLKRHLDSGQIPVIIHLGDHDPSGIDMTRDIGDRLELFIGEPVMVERIALNMDQVRQYRPPPNPAKLTDVRATKYIALHGDQSWELDALEPTVLDALIQRNIEEFRDAELWQKRVDAEDEEREVLTAASARWRDVATFLTPQPTTTWGDTPFSHCEVHDATYITDDGCEQCENEMDYSGDDKD